MALKRDLPHLTPVAPSASYFYPVFVFVFLFLFVFVFVSASLDTSLLLPTFVLNIHILFLNFNSVWLHFILGLSFGNLSEKKGRVSIQNDSLLENWVILPNS